jgi:23S rRNA (guanosine2251-2'-O)-methyltransferase
MAQHIIWGRNTVLEALRSPGQVNRVYVAKDTKVKGRDEVLDAARSAGVPFDFVPQAKLNTQTGTGDHQGLAAVISPVTYTSLETCLQSCPAKATILVLDGVQHPKNLGMLVRTAAGAGAIALLVAARGGALLDETVLRASAGTLFHLPVVRMNNVAQTLRKLQEESFWIYGLDAKGEHNALTMDWPDRCALVLGSESEGLRPGVRKACDDLVRIPLTKNVESLNVAVAAGIALFQAKSGNNT